MTIAFSIPFWLLLIVILAIGLSISFIIPESKYDYDFFTPLLKFGITLITLILVIGLALGKYVF